MTAAATSRREIAPSSTPADKAFRGTVRGAAVLALSVMGLIGVFLFLRALPALQVTGWRFLTTAEWLPGVGHFGVAAVLEGTILIAGIALLVAVPVGFGASIWIAEYAPRHLRPALVSLVDLMAAVPSIVYGLWGFFFVQPHLIPVSRWLSENLGPALPFLRVDNAETDSSFASSAFIAGCVVGVMVVPTVTSIMREVFSQAPTGEREAALALGGTQWAVVRRVVVPFGRSGIIGGSMLGLGRALGETVAVYLIISPVFAVTTHPLQSGTHTISALIATLSTESSGVALSGLLAAGLVLFLFTLLVNAGAAVVVNRSRSGQVTG
ncbi:MAG: phosphate transporter permease subunit PstC [Frankiales bacterium]|nr:phosphate transporter permease subunit PstC [Frankiales bacterium]